MRNLRQIGQDGWFVRDLTTGHIIDFIIVFVVNYKLLYPDAILSSYSAFRAAADLQIRMILVRCDRFMPDGREGLSVTRFLIAI